ncbi:DoxX family protein [Nocardia sp. NPDC058497]|uniref:DoxX family protein n=1 Tax=Nocardia sp. NPDC058497 TaxID=3346529 RepID=UPI003669F546
MNISIWIATGLLAVVALGGGISKTFIPQTKLAAQRGGEWARAVSPGFIKAIGIAELLAAAGLILPAVLDIAPIMVAVTATCWVALMIGAMITHGRLGQIALVAVNAVYLAVAVFVAWGRFALEPFTG